MEKIELNDQWMLKNDNESIEINVEVPSSVFENLINHGEIMDPFYGENEHQMNGILKSEWIFEKTFDISPDFLSLDNILLTFHGIDTISEIFLNEKKIGVTDNMFKKFEFNVKTLLKTTGNLLIVKIKSPIKEARAKVKKYRKRLQTSHNGIGAPYLRKAQYSYGWDWGPALPDIGIWKPVEIIGYNDLRIGSIQIHQELSYNKDPLKITNLEEYEILNVESVDLKVVINIQSSEEDIDALKHGIRAEFIPPKADLMIQEHPLKSNEVILHYIFKDPELWWTHDLGQPQLHELNVYLFKEDTVDSKSLKIGIREIKLIREKDQWGESFYFRLNGVPIFAKGANWVPIDSFIPRGKKLNLYEKLLKDVKIANVNMVRVWGGGIYEDEAFYDLCDELGILVWQDFPFACSIYPIHQDFFENVREEVIENVERLRNHASLALWCGNNEIEQGWNWYLLNCRIWKPKDKKKYELGYLKMFKEMIPNLIEELDPQHAYWPSSSLDKWDGERVLSKEPNGPNEGDSHFWKVWHGSAPFSAYRRFNSRFMSEFGFESFPSMKTISSFCPPEQYFFDSLIMENHQKNEAGNKKIMKYMKRRFGIPESFEKQVILSQITQAEAIQYGVEHWRQNRNDFHCMGALYWQLNDCWPVASWSSIDYFGRWKALHYLARRFFEPVLPSVRESRKTIRFYLNNSYNKFISGNYDWSILNANGIQILQGSEQISIPPCSSIQVKVVKIEEIDVLKKNRTNKIIFYTFTFQDGDIINKSEGFKLLDAPKRFPLMNPRLSFRIKEMPSEVPELLKYEVIVHSEKIAIYVFLESEVIDFFASDNFFSMRAGQARKLVLEVPIHQGEKHDKIDDLLRNTLKVQSLQDLVN